MNGRVYDGNELEAFFWDGKTNYAKSKESKDEIEKNIEEFGAWLHQEKEN